MRRLQRLTGGGRVGLCVLAVLVAASLASAFASPVRADASVGVASPFGGQGGGSNVFPCGVGENFNCQAYGGPSGGVYTWTIGGQQYGPYGSGTLTFVPSEPTRYLVSVLYYVEGSGSDTDSGAPIQGIEAQPRVGGATEAYINVDGPRKEVQLGFAPSSGGQRHYLYLTVPSGLVAYESETAQTPMSVHQWDDYSLNNWAGKPSSIWIEATATGEKVLQFEFRMSNYIEPFGTWYTGTHVGR